MTMIKEQTSVQFSSDQHTVQQNPHYWPT